MFIELVDSFRCVHPHPDTWLVAVTQRMVGRDIIEGRLGCPVCKAEFLIVGGVLYVDSPLVASPEELTSTSLAVNPDTALRCAAFLGLSEPGGFVVASGGWASSARELVDLTHVHVLVVNPPTTLELGGGVSGIRVRDSLPLARHSARGAALDGPGAEALLDGSTRAVRPSGRVVAPADLPLPASLSELARDDQYWVGEVVAAPVPVIRIGRPPAPHG